MNRYRAKTPLDQLTEKTAIWLNNNFHKLSQTNKIKVSLEIVKRAMPTNPLVDTSTHYHFTNLQGEKLVAEAKRRNLPIPEALARKFGDT